VAFRQAEKLDGVGVLEDALSLGMDLSRHRRDFWRESTVRSKRAAWNCRSNWRLLHISLTAIRR
jgi:hypothetical protein